MRCHICDWSYGDKSSAYHEGLELKHSQENKVIYDEDTRKFICLDCLSESCYNILGDIEAIGDDPILEPELTDEELLDQFEQFLESNKQPD